MDTDNKNLDNHEWDVSSAQLKRTHGFALPGNMKKMNASAAEAENLAIEILKFSRNTLLINMRFLEAAFVRFVPGRELVTRQIACDGQFLYYNSIFICREFLKEDKLIARDYLHIVLHCLFRHLFVNSDLKKKEIWDLACDIAVENIITKLGKNAFTCAREAEQAWIIEKLKSEIPKLTAEWIYKYFCEQSITPDECRQLRRNFIADDHEIWYKSPEFSAGNGEGDEREQAEPETGLNETEGNTDAQNEDSFESDIQSNDTGDGSSSDSSKNSDHSDLESKEMAEDSELKETDDKTKEQTLSKEELEKMWKDISEKIQVEMDTVTNSWGEGTGDMLQTLKEINKEEYNYSEFLKRFSVQGENLQINDEEFDYIFYTYGMKLYGNIPLIEPLEYKEVKKVREFVIALDTSESVSGDTVQKFVTKTWNILKQSDNFFNKTNIHIMQCGARVEEDVKITCQEEFDRYIEHMVLKGFGGTDFRPVFEKIDTLIKQGEFQNLKGLIYFTDGYGTFPAMPPSYDAAFVFLDRGLDFPPLPAWAIKIVLSDDVIG